MALRDESATREDRTRFAAWLREEAENRAAWGDVAEIWTGLDRLPQAARARISLRPMAVTTGRGKSWRWAAMAAMVAGLALIGLLTLQAPGLAWRVLADHYTGPQDRLDVALPDGSTVSLGASSALSVAFDGMRRHVVLHRGEAYFAVVPDPDHPFIVAAGSGTVTVLGTKFGVKIADERVTVGVAEGVVSVAAGPGAPIQLKRGETARYGAGTVMRSAGVDLADVGSWRNGRLIFQGVPLDEVLADLERYRGGRIFVTDETLAALPVTGVFDIKRADGALDTIARALPIRVTRIGALLVLVQPAE